MTNAQLYLEDLKTKFDKINPKEYYLSYSGGKDSHLLYWFIKEYAHIDGIKVVGINTYMEHPEIRQRIYDNCDIVLLPVKKPHEIKEQYGIPCFSKTQDELIYLYQRGSRAEYLLDRIYDRDFLGKDGKMHPNKFGLNKKSRELLLNNKLHPISKKCCDFLKKKPAHKFEKENNLKPILGVRSYEGATRKAKYKSCFTKDMKFTPIWDLDDKLLNEIYNEFNIEIPSIYNYVTRTGCMGCPYGHYAHEVEKELALLCGNQKKFICDYFKESYEILGIKTDDEK